MSNIERVALSLGLSIVTVILVGFILNYTPWGIRLYPILVSLSVFIISTSLIAAYRRYKLPGTEQPVISLSLRFLSWRPRGSQQWLVSSLLLVAIIGAFGILTYVATLPKVGEGFTQFYVLGLDGKTEGYPVEALVGVETQVIIAIENREHMTVTYRLQVRIDGVTESDIGPLVLDTGGKWQRTVGFTPSRAGDNQKVEFLLYRDGEIKPYLEPLHLWIDVKG